MSQKAWIVSDYGLRQLSLQRRQAASNSGERPCQASITSPQSPVTPCGISTFTPASLGLRFVKKTVNFDDPGTYHFYYGDEAGSPGTILTFFPWEGAAAGRGGVGQTQQTAFRVPAALARLLDPSLHRKGHRP